MKDPARFPLSWPHGWPRTETLRSSRFKSQRRDITISAAVERLERELNYLAATDALMSSNLKLGVSGVPLSGQAEPKDRGVAIYFKLGGADRVLACDRYLSCAGNIAAIANHIDALRRIERYGVGSIAQAFAGYAALPPPSPENRPAWRKILRFPPLAAVSPDDVKIAFRSQLRATDPNDQGRLTELNLARDAAFQELGIDPRYRPHAPVTPSPPVTKE